MNKKLLSLILIIGLIGSASAAAGDQVACGAAGSAELTAAIAAGIDKCAEGDSSAVLATQAAKCLPGYAFVAGADVQTGTCSQCAVGTYWSDAADAKATTTSRSCTACVYANGLTAPAGSDVIADCVACAKGKALNVDTKLCIDIPLTGTTGIVAGGRVYTTTTAALTTFTLVSCDQTDGYQETKSSNACVECTNRTSSGCATCEAAPGTCTACRTGFRNTAAAGAATATCSVCTGECAECDSTGTNGAEKCTKAKDGSYLAANNVVTKCPDNATKCEWDATVPASPVVKVTAVKAGYYIKTGATNVATKCPTGKTSAANSDLAQAEGGATSCTISCATKCLNCDVAGVGKCDACENDYYIDAAPTVATAVCVQFTETTRPATCQTASANDANSCTSCSAEQFRERDPAAPTTDTKFKCTCQAGYTDVSNVAAPATKSPICKKCGTGVKNCDAGQAIVCTNAADQVAGENCYPTTTGQGTIQGFFYDSATTAFKACDTTCLTCAGGDATKCVTCAQITVDTTQLTEQDVQTLSAAWSNGTYTATAPGTCYAKCPEGYQTDPAVRTACEMASFGNILSAIVLISFIILMF